MATNEDTRLADGVWYRCRVAEGAGFGESAQKATPFIRVNFVVADGDLSGVVIPGEFYVTEGTKENVAAMLAVLGFEKGAKLSSMEAAITGKLCDVQGQWNVFKESRKFRANRVRPPVDGSKTPAQRIAEILGAPDADTSDVPF